MSSESKTEKTDTNAFDKAKQKAEEFRKLMNVKDDKETSSIEIEGKVTESNKNCDEVTKIVEVKVANKSETDADDEMKKIHEAVKKPLFLHSTLA